MRLFRTERFKKLYRKLPDPIKKKLARQLSYLLQDIRHHSLQAKKMVNRPDIYEARVDIHNRFTFKVAGDRITLRVVGPHDVLRNP